MRRFNLREPRSVRFEDGPPPNRPLEKRVWQKTVFKDIDMTDPKNYYHVDMLRGLMYQPSALDPRDPKKPSLIREIFTAEDALNGALDEVVVEAVVATDISFNVGTKRNVDRFLFRFSDGKEISVTVSLDRERYDRASDSASLAEAAVLSRMENNVLAFQKYYGALSLPTVDGRRGLICKEYLPGVMLESVMKNQALLEGVGTSVSMQEVIQATAEMVAITLKQARGLPVDSHGMNVILHHDDRNQTLTGRYCDVEYVRNDVPGIRAEVGAMYRAFREHGSVFLRALDKALEGSEARVWVFS